MSLTFFSRTVNQRVKLLPVIFTLFLLTTIPVYAQDSIVLKGTFLNNTKYAKVLMKQFGVGNFIVGGSYIQKDRFVLKLPPSIEPGVYRFQYAMEENKSIDIIINGEDREIEFSLDVASDEGIPVFSKSRENTQWYLYVKEYASQLKKINLIAQFLNAYPDRNALVFKAALQEYEQEQQAYFKNLETFKSTMIDTWAYEMVANRPYYFTTPTEDFRIQDAHKRDHFWDNFNATNPKLLNTPLYTDHILNYLRFWMNPVMNFSAQEKIAGFKKDIDTIIKIFSGNSKTQEFAYKYLTLGFKELGEEEVLQYVDEKYKDIAKQCLDTSEKSEFDKRMQGYAKLKEGSMAPNFELHLENFKAKENSLYKVKATKILLVFWSSSCPHCLEELPKVNTWAGTQTKNVKVIAVSIDTDKSAYEEAIKKYPNLIHSCDFKGWDTMAASNYYIVATPTFILLDKGKKIKGKFPSFEQCLTKIDVL